MIKYIIAIFLSVCLVGCGFHPLYVSDSNQDLLQKTASIQIEPISEGIGYQIGLALESKLNPRQLNTPKKYRLSVVFKDPVLYNQSIRSDNFASLENMQLDASYQLTDIKTHKVVISSQINANGLYNIVKEPYASIVAEDKLYHNLADLIAEDISMHILSYFKGENP